MNALMLNNFRKIKKYYSKRKELRRIKREISQQFLQGVGYSPSIDYPHSFNEKLQWLKLYHKDPLMTKCADKYLVREYVSKKIGDEYLVKMINIYNSVDEIEFDSLPEKFVLKVNHGSGQNIICKDKGKFNVQEAKLKLREWMKPESNHYYYSYEWCYKNIEPKIICEEYLEDLSDADLKDYKFMCFNGKTELMFVCSERGAKLKVDFFDLNWQKLPFTRLYANSKNEIKKPENFDKMVEFANKLAKPFPFVRVDFYEINERMYFGELTFYPGNGMEPFDPPEWDYRLGSMLKLPNKYK